MFAPVARLVVPSVGLPAGRLAAGLSITVVDAFLFHSLRAVFLRLRELLAGHATRGRIAREMDSRYVCHAGWLAGWLAAWLAL